MSSSGKTIIDVVAPGFKFDSHLLKEAKQKLLAHSIVLRIPPNLKGPDLLFANSDKERAQQLKKAIQAQDSEFIWCVRGGSGSYRLLKYLDKELALISRKKTIIGYSDITSLLNYAFEKKSWVGLHASLIENVASPGRESDITRLVDVIHGKPLKGFSVKALNAKAEVKREVKGVVRGGNLCVICSQIGTPFKMNFEKDTLLFLEDIGERAYKLDKMLWQLEESGSLKNVKALVFGEFLGGHEKNGKSLVNRFLKQYASMSKIPIFHCKHFGHGKNKSPFPVGGKVHILKSSQANFELSFKLR